MKSANFFLSGLLLCATAMFSGCENEPEIPSAITVADEQSLTQDVFADETSGTGGVTFLTAGAWTSSIAEASPVSASTSITKSVPQTRAGSTAWISISPDHGDVAGSYTVVVNLVPNTTGADRTAVITIRCGETDITITVTQKGTKADGTVPINPNSDNIVHIPITDYLITLVGADGEKRTALTQANNWGKAAEVLGYSGAQGLVNALLPMITHYQGMEVTAVAMYDRNADGAYVAITASTPFAFTSTVLAYVEFENLTPANPVNIVGTWLNVTAGNYSKYAFLTEIQFEYYSNDARIKQGTYELNSTELMLKVINSDGTTTIETHQFSINATGSTIYLDNMAYDKQTGNNPNPSAPEALYVKNYLFDIARNASSGAITDIDALLTQAVIWRGVWSTLGSYTGGAYISSLDALLADLKRRIETDKGKEVAAMYASNVPGSNNTYPPVVDSTPLGYNADGTANPTNPVIYVVWKQ